MRLFKIKKCNRIQKLHFTPDSRQLMLVGGARASQVDRALWLDLASGDVAVNLPLFEDAPLGQAYAIASDQSRLVIGQTVYQADQLPELFKVCQPRRSPGVWHPCPIPFDWAPNTFSYNVVDLALAPDGMRLAAAVEHQFNYDDDDQGPYFTYFLLDWRLALDGAVESFSSRPWEPCHSLTFTPDGARWAAARQLRVHFELSVFRNLSEPPLNDLVAGRRLRGLLFSPDGRILAGIVLRTVCLLDSESLARRGVLASSGQAMVNDIAFTPDSHTLLMASGDGLARVWDVASSRLMRTFEWGIGPITAVACSPDGTLCAAGSKNGQVVLWDAEQ